MQTRWMLWLEHEHTLKLLAGIPRRWLEDGKSITLRRVASYFGPLDLQVVSQVNTGSIHASITLRDQRRLPASVTLRLPHPEGRKAVGVEGGRYDPKTETVTVTLVRGKAKVRLVF
jgi:hypothetical protein